MLSLSLCLMNTGLVTAFFNGAEGDVGLRLTNEKKGDITSLPGVRSAEADTR